MADEKVVTVALSKIAAELAEKHEMSKKAMNEPSRVRVHCNSGETDSFMRAIPVRGGLDLIRRPRARISPRKTPKTRN
mgnify:CR=1 FL=1